MSIKGTAAKSSSGAAMSKYDVEVESRLQALESKALPQQDSGDSVDPAKLEELWQWYQQVKKHV